ncbi:MAG: glycosyltransferase family 2 protein [Anaerolineae bacterium]|nr:glycosyltransferase family 2 protein [Anaerolineae bacterium]
MTAVSIHIVTYNSAGSIRTCIDSVLAQEFRDYNLHIFDNSSNDATVQIVRSLDLPIIRQQHNLGYAAAHNYLIDNTSSRYVLTLNPDVQLESGFLKAMVTTLDAQPKVGSASGLLLRVDHLGDQPTVIDSAGVHMQRNRRQGLRYDGLPIEQAPTQVQRIFGPDGAAAFYRRAMLDDVRNAGEVFDSDFWMHKEDIDLNWRALWRGWESLYVPTARAQHVRGFRPGQRDRVSEQMKLLGVRNRYLLMLKHERSSYLLRDLLPIAAYEIGILGYLLLRERSSLRAYAQAWALRGKMAEKRREIEAKRRAKVADVMRWLSISEMD